MVDDLRQFVAHNDGTNKEVFANVRIKARLLSIAPDFVGDPPFLRPYCGEWQTSEPFEEQQQAFKDAQRKDPFEANQFLFTVSLLKVDINNRKLPCPGDIVTITPYKLNVYHSCCQIDAKLYGICTIDSPR